MNNFLFLLQRQTISPKMISHREIVRFEVNYHLMNLHEGGSEHQLGPYITWIRQPENQLSRINHTHRLAQNLKQKYLQANPGSEDLEIVVSKIEIKGTALFGHELHLAPLSILQNDDVVDVYLTIATKDSQPLLPESEDETSSQNDTFDETLEEESQDLLAKRAKKTKDRK